MSDSVCLDAWHLSPEAKRGLELLCSERGWGDLDGHFFEPEIIAWLVFRLETVPDSPRYFPKEKWATIQHLQRLLRSVAKLGEAKRTGDHHP